MQAIHKPGHGKTFLQRFQVQLRQSEPQRAEPNPLKRLAQFLVAFSLPFVLYALTAAPTVYYLDSAELTTAAASGGLVHPTGYPLYLVLGWLWTRIPVGDIGYRMNMFSALNGALTLALAAAILRRLRIRPWARWSALGLLATGYYFWGLSIIAEVYTLHTALMALIILLVLRWLKAPTAQNLVWIGLAVGLSFGNHASTLLLIPGLAWLLIRHRERWLTLQNVALAAGAFALGLSIYLYLPLRYAANPAFNYLQHYDENGIAHPINLQTVNGFWSVISGQTFQQHMLSDPNIIGSALSFGTQLIRDFWFIGLGPGLLGLVQLWKRNRSIGGMVLGMFVAHALFYILYRVPDKATMYLPNYLIIALWIGIGLESIFTSLEDIQPRTQSKRFIWLARLTLTATICLGLMWNWPLVDLSENYEARQRAEHILKNLEPNALLLGRWDLIPVIEYLQIIEGMRGDVEAINTFMISKENTLILIEQAIQERAVYVDQMTRSLMENFTLDYDLGLYRLSQKEVSLPANH